MKRYCIIDQELCSQRWGLEECIDGGWVEYEDAQREIQEARRLAEKYHMYAINGTFPASSDEGIPWEAGK